MKPIRGTYLHGIAFAQGDPWTVQYVYPGSIDILRRGSQRESGHPERVITLAELAEPMQAGVDPLVDARWRPKVTKETRQWVQAVTAAEQQVQHAWYTHGDEVVLVWSSVPSREHEAELVATGFRPAGATWRAPLFADTKRLAQRLAREPALWHRPAFARIQGPPELRASGEDELEARADQAWARWWSLFRTEVRGYPMHGRPTLDVDKGTLSLIFLRGNAMWQVRLDLRRHPLIYPVVFERGNTTLELPGLAWEDFYMIPQFVADLGQGRTANYVLPKQGHAIADPPPRRELTDDQIAFLEDLVRDHRAIDLGDITRVSARLGRRRDAEPSHIQSEARLVTEAILLQARGLNVQLFLEPWGRLVVLHEGEIAASRGFDETTLALAPDLGEADRIDILGAFRSAARQAGELVQSAGARAPALARALLRGDDPPPAPAAKAKQPDNRWSTDVIEAFERAPGPHLHLDRLHGNGQSGRFILVREGGAPDNLADRLATITLQRDRVEEVDWAESARNVASRAALEIRLATALATARGELSDPTLFSNFVDDLARRVEALGTARDPEEELAEILDDLRESTYPGEFIPWLAEQGWDEAAQYLNEWDGENTRNFLAGFWDMLRDAYIQTTEVGSDGASLLVSAESLSRLEGDAVVYQLSGDPPDVREVEVVVRACGEDTCQVFAPIGGLERGDNVYNLKAHTREQVHALHRHLAAMRASLARAPQALNELRRALRLTARLIESPHCQGGERSAAAALLKRAWRIHDAARTLVLDGRPDESRYLAQESAELLARASAEAGALCAAGRQELPFTDDPVNKPSPALLPEPEPEPEPAPEPDESPLAPLIGQLAEQLTARGFDPDRAAPRSASRELLGDVRQVLGLSAALLRVSSPDHDPSAALPTVIPEPSPDRLVVDLGSLREALGEGDEILAKLGTVKASGGLRGNISALWALMTTNVYRSGDLPVLATRETLQNGVDAIRAAVRLRKIRPNEGRFAVTWDPSRRALTWEDNGVGMDTDTIFSKFLSLGDSGKRDGDDRDAVGGFGLAKAVILGTSASFRWELHTRDNFAVSEGPKAEIQVHEADFLQGTRITIFDVQPEFDNTYDYARQTYISLVDRVRELLAASDLPDINLTVNGEPVRPMFSRRAGSIIRATGNWGEGTTAVIKAHRRPPGDRQGSYYVRLGGLFQFMKPSHRGELKVDVVIDFTTTARPLHREYPLNLARDGLQEPARSAMYDLIEVVERESESTGRAEEYEIYDPESDPDGSGAAELAGLAAEALADTEFQAVLTAAAGGIVDYYAERAKSHSVDTPVSSLAPPGSRAPSEHDGPTRSAVLPPGLKFAARVSEVEADIAAPAGAPAVEAARELRAVLASADEVEAVTGRKDMAFKEGVTGILDRVEAGETLDEGDIKTLAHAIDRAADTAIGPGGGGLLQAVALVRTADHALGQLAADEGAKKIVRPRNPFGRFAGLRISRQQYDRRRAYRFRKDFARWLPHLALWDATLRLLAAETRIRRTFRPGFVLDDTVAGMCSADVVFIQPDKLAQVIKAHRERPMGIAAYLHGIACHELTHLDGRLLEGHSESFTVAREDMGFATGHLIPVIALLAQRLLKLPRKPSEEERRIAVLERKLERTRQSARAGGKPMADVAGLQRQLASARAAQAEAEAESARIRAECDERVAAARASDKPCSEAHIARDRAADALAQATQYYDAVRVRADVAVLPGVHAALRNLAANVARLVLRCLEALPELDIATDRAMLDRELGRISA